MISRLARQGAHDPRDHHPSTLLLACAEADGLPAEQTPLLRHHAIVLRTHGGEIPLGDDGPLSTLLASRPFRRLVVVAHRQCDARRAHPDAEPVRSTAAIAAWCRYAPAAQRLAEAFARGELSQSALGAKVDLLVQLANLAGCVEVARGLASGALELSGVVWDAEDRRFELFDGLGFRPLDDDELERLIAGDEGAEHGLRDLWGDVPVSVVAAPSDPPPGALSGGAA